MKRAHREAWHRKYGPNRSYIPNVRDRAAIAGIAKAVWEAATEKTAPGGDVDTTAASMLRTLFAAYMLDNGRAGFNLEAQAHPLGPALGGITGYLKGWRPAPPTPAPALATPPTPPPSAPAPTTTPAETTATPSPTTPTAPPATPPPPATPREALALSAGCAADALKVLENLPPVRRISRPTPAISRPALAKCGEVSPASEPPSRRPTSGESR